ncbi:hypothetical protein RYX36_002370, partial [Vicia faba]
MTARQFDTKIKSRHVFSSEEDGDIHFIGGRTHGGPDDRRKKMKRFEFLIFRRGTKKGEIFLGDVNTQLKNKNISTDIKLDISSNIFHNHHCQRTCSCVIGTNALAFGVDLAFDTKLGELTKSNIVVNFVKDDLIWSLTLNEKACIGSTDHIEGLRYELRQNMPLPIDEDDEKMREIYKSLLQR